MGNSSKRDARLVKIRERQARSLKLRLTGATYDQVAREVGHPDRSNARKDVMDAIAEIIREPAEEVRAMELARLDAMLLGLWPLASKGDPVAVAHVLRIQDRRAAYLGLDAPKTTRIAGADGGPVRFLNDADMVKLPTEQLRAIAEGRPVPDVQPLHRPDEGGPGEGKGDPRSEG